tara:strand:+ start:48 stop:578 length:531 start_codon:yes stop_codon:yes gene_type:complete
MRIDLFSIPIFIGNIDSEKLVIEDETFDKAWWSKTTSSYNNNHKNKLQDESTKYLLKNIASLLKDKIKNPFEVQLSNIWSNKYDKNDYQEEHIHSNSHFSFIIYKNVKESRTKFISAWRDIITAYEMNNLFCENFSVECRSNQICVFPSFVKHLVSKNNFPGETIAGNILIKIKHG